MKLFLDSFFIVTQIILGNSLYSPKLYKYNKLSYISYTNNLRTNKEICIGEDF